MIYLSGSVADSYQALLIAAGIGLMIQPGNSYHRRIAAFRYWAADNGCFADQWDEDRWIKWLELLDPAAGCLFAVAPDKYPDAIESLRRGLDFAPIVRDMGFPVAVVAQDGAERLDWAWDEMDCLFLGGRQRERSRLEWKESAAAASLARRARAAGKWVHMGRVNSLRRLKIAQFMGCQSVDGNLIKWRRRGAEPGVRVSDAEGAVLSHTHFVNTNPPLPFERWETPSHPTHRGLT